MCLLDDHVGLGGTVANLRGYVEARGGRVLAITTLTESREARQNSLRAETLAMLRERHGKARLPVDAKDTFAAIRADVGRLTKQKKLADSIPSRGTGKNVTLIASSET
jgi:hypothetical protein